MTAQELLAPLFPLVNFTNTQIDNVTECTQQANQHSVFVCIRGAHTDGHHLASKAYENGCRFFVAERPVQLPDDALVLQSANTRMALAELACRFYRHPSQKMHLIGITGTKGKTTTALLLAHILNHNQIPCGYIGTNGIFYGTQKGKTKNTTPDAVTLQKTLFEMKAAGIKAVVLEVSSQALAQHRVDGTHFETVVFTNFSRDHIGATEHPTMKDYQNAKHRLFCDFGAFNAVWNLDDKTTPLMRLGTTAQRHITCSCLQKDATLSAESIAPTQNNRNLGISFTLATAKEKIPCSLPLIGRCNVNNALQALAVATEIFSLSIKEAIQTLSYATVEGRSEYIPLPFHCAAVIDYAHNGESLRQFLLSLREYHPKRLICLFGSVGERSQLRRRELGDVAAELSDLCILTSDNPGNEPTEQILNDIEASFIGKNTPYFKITEREDAILFALDLMQEGDLLAIVGKGHETYQLVGNEHIPFCEREIIERHSAATHT